MTTLQCLIASFTVITVAAIYAVQSVVKSEADVGNGLIGRTLVVHTRKPDDQSIRGTVHAFDVQLVVLREAMYLNADGKHQPAGGIVTIPRANISNWQELPAEALTA